MAYDYTSDYVNYEGYGAGSSSDWTTSQYPTQNAYDSIYGSGGKRDGGGRGRGGGGKERGRGRGGASRGGGRGGGGRGGGGVRGGGGGYRIGGGRGGGSGGRGGGGGGWGGGSGGGVKRDGGGYRGQYDEPAKKKKPAEDFHCDMCDVTSNNKETFETHLVGSRHLTNMEKLEKGEKLVKGSKKRRQTHGSTINLMTLDEVIAGSTEPLIGLEYIGLEATDGPEGYYCEGCQSRMNIGNVVAHLTGGRHRENYIMKNPVHETYAAEIKSYTEELETEERARVEQKVAQGEEPESDEVYPKRSLINKKLHHFAIIIEEQYGRQAHKVTVDHAAEAKRKIAKEKAAKIAIINEPGAGKKGKKLQKWDIERMVYEGEEPMIGLDKVTELVKEGEENQMYQCDVCDTVLNHGNLHSHVSGVKHRHNYITMFHPELKEELKKQRKETEEANKDDSVDERETAQKTSHDRTVFIREMSFKVESLTGRKKMKREFIPNPDKKKTAPKPKSLLSVGGRGQSSRGGQSRGRRDDYGGGRGGGRGGGGRDSGGRGRGGRDGGRGGRDSGGRGRGGRDGGGRGRGGRDSGGRSGGRGGRMDDFGNHYGGDHGYGGDGYGADYYGDDYYARPSQQDMHDDRVDWSQSYNTGADPRDAIRARMRRSSEGTGGYSDFERPPRRRPAPPEYDDFYTAEYNRRPSMDFGGSMSGGGMRATPKRKEESKEASDAFILAEFEKRFGKRIKLGDDSDTLVLGSGMSQNNARGSSGVAPPSLLDQSSPYGDFKTSSSAVDPYGSSSYGGGSGSYSADNYLTGSSSSYLGTSSGGGAYTYDRY